MTDKICCSKEYDGKMHLNPKYLDHYCKNCKYRIIVNKELRCSLDGIEISKFAQTLGRSCGGGGGR